MTNVSAEAAPRPGQLNYVLASILIYWGIILIGHLSSFGFVAYVLIGMFIGRKVGWAFSEAILSGGPLRVIISLCVAWGMLFGFGLHVLIREFQPSLIALVFGYGVGTYASVPNFGLFAPGSIPSMREDRRSLIEAAPWLAFAIIIEVVPRLAFAITSVALYFV
jgi:hypothetical protein